MTNILVLSSGTRNKIVQYFKRALTDENGNRTGKVIATDLSEWAPSIYDADKYYLVPRVTEENYIDTILDICKKEEITGVLSLIDTELSILAENKDRFAELGATVIGSSHELNVIALDKMLMYLWLNDHGYKTARSYTSREEFYNDLDNEKISFPVFVKPVRGSAALSISKVNDRDVLDLLFEKDDNLMIQEFMNGQEIGADVYIDMISGEIVSIFTKNKLVMRAGETDKSVSIKDDRLFDLIEKFVKEIGFTGQIDIDVFDINGEYYISEVNPRFGGGYPHAYECGVDHMKLIVSNLQGKANEKMIGNYKENGYMMKYSEIKIKQVWYEKWR